MQQKKVDKVMEEYQKIFTSPTYVPFHCQVKHSIEMTHDTPFPNGSLYQCSLLENDNIMCQIQEFLQKENIQPRSSPCEAQLFLLSHEF
jgi:hypothetical protein